MDLNKANCMTVNEDDLIGEKSEKAIKSDNTANHQKSQQQQLPSKQQKQVDDGSIIDVLHELTQKNNPQPLVAIFDKINIMEKIQDGTILFKLILNRQLPIDQLVNGNQIKSVIDQDGKSLLHYAIQCDDDQMVQWLLRNGCENVADKFGNTPVMDAVRLGRKKGLLLCLHYQHTNQNLVHLAAEYNRVWELKVLQALGFRVDVKNSKNKTPFEVAVQNYSYQAVEYLAMVTHNYNTSQQSIQTDSDAIILRVRKGRSNSSYIQQTLIPLVQKLLFLIFLVLNVGYNEIYNGSRGRQLLFLSFYVFFFLLIFVFNWICKNKIQSNNGNVFNIIQKCYKNVDVNCICPSCFRVYNPQHFDHCHICHCCVQKFHQHRYVCINKNNQVFWYICQYFCMYMLYSLLKQGIYYCNLQIAGKESEGFLYDIVFNAYYLIYMKQSYYTGVYLIILLGLFVQQLLFCFQLLLMMILNRTYKQITQTQNYPHLYSVYKSKDGKYKTKEIRIFEKYKGWGIVVGIKNILTYFL